MTSDAAPGGRPVVGIFMGLGAELESDRYMAMVEKQALESVTEWLEVHGLAVEVIDGAEPEDLIRFISLRADDDSDSVPVACIWSSHGADEGKLISASGQGFGPGEVTRELRAANAEVAASLRLAVFTSCHTGSSARRWHEALGGNVTILGYDGVVTVGDIVRLYRGQDHVQQLIPLLRAYLLNPVLA